MRIRDECPDDAPAIRRLHDEAFSDIAEGRLVDELRGSGDVAVSLVMDDGDSMAGHLLFSHLILRCGGRLIRAAALAPLTVLPERQLQGMGSALVQEGLRRCREAGFQAVVVLGDPAYYRRFGFSVEKAARVRCQYHRTHLMALGLDPGCLSAGQCAARYPTAFDLVG
jgi:putative acetyltransferase